MPNQKNLDAVKKLREKIAEAKSIVFAEYHGLNSNSANELRSKIKESNAEVTISKNSLMKIALKEEKVDTKELENYIKGPVATVFGYEDALSPIKTIAEFAVKLDLPKMVAGIVDGEFISAEKLEILSKLPSKDELMTRIVRGLKSPLFKLSNALGDTQRKFVYVLSAAAEKAAKTEGVS